MSMMPSNWEQELEGELGAPDAPATKEFFDAWAQEEHGSVDGPWGGYDQGGAFNPFDTTLGEPGATDYNSVGVKSYTSEAQGLEATASTLEEAPYANLLADIRSGASLATLEQAEDASPWGTAFPDVPTYPPSGSGSSGSSGTPAATLDSNPISDVTSAITNPILQAVLRMVFVAIGGGLVIVGGFKMAGQDPSSLLKLAPLAVAA